MEAIDIETDEIEIEDAPEVFPLAPAEQQTLEQCEAVIMRGLTTFIEVGEALAKIREGKLYRQHYNTWEEYCTDRWGIGRGRAYQLISAAVVTREMSTVVDNPPTNEREARAIAKAAPADRPAVIQRATELAGDQPRTAKHIEQAAAEISAPDLPPEYDIIKRRLATHGLALLSNMQGHHRAYVTRKEGMTGVVTFNWADVLSKLERLEAQPDPDPAGAAFRMTCPTCGETILNGIWGDLKECGECYHARQQQQTAPAAPTLADLDALLPPDLFKTGYFWRSATPPTIRNNDGWQADAPTVDQAIQAAYSRERGKATLTLVLDLREKEQGTAFPGLPTDGTKLRESIDAVLRLVSALGPGPQRKVAPAMAVLRAARRAALDETRS